MVDTSNNMGSVDSQLGLDGPFDLKTAHAVRAMLLQLADAQERIAAEEAALVPYWKPCPQSVIGARAAARALRASAERMLVPSSRSAA